MKLLKAVRKFLGIKEKPRKPAYMWEILNMIIPSDKPWRKSDPFLVDPLADMRIRDVFPPKASSTN